MAGKGSTPGERRGGRAKGTPNRVTQAARERIDDYGDPIGFLLDIMNGNPIEASSTKDGAEAASIIPTLDQRQSAANTLARKLVPDAKDKAITVTMPKIKATEDIVRAIDTVLAAVASGQITPSEGQVLASIVENYRKAVETYELEQRITVLERTE